MKKYIKPILLFLATVLIFSKSFSQTIPSCTTTSIPFNNTDLCKIYGAILTTSTSGGGSVTISDTLSIYDNSQDTLNNNLQRINRALYSFPDGFSNADLNKQTADRLLDPNTGSTQAELSYQILSSLNNNTLNVNVTNSLTTTVSNTVSATITNTNLATSANQITQISKLNQLVGNIPNSNIPYVYTFENSDATSLMADVQNYMFGSPSEIIQFIQFTSTCYWNGVTEVCKHTCFIIVK